jgi:hypothetical protein
VVTIVVVLTVESVKIGVDSRAIVLSVVAIIGVDAITPLPLPLPPTVETVTDDDDAANEVDAPNALVSNANPLDNDEDDATVDGAADILGGVEKVKPLVELLLVLVLGVLPKPPNPPNPLLLLLLVIASVLELPFPFPLPLPPKLDAVVVISVLLGVTEAPNTNPPSTFGGGTAVKSAPALAKENLDDVDEVDDDAVDVSDEDAAGRENDHDVVDVLVPLLTSPLALLPKLGFDPDDVNENAFDVDEEEDGADDPNDDENEKPDVDEDDVDDALSLLPLNELNDDVDDDGANAKLPLDEGGVVNAGAENTNGVDAVEGDVDAVDDEFVDINVRLAVFGVKNCPLFVVVAVVDDDDDDDRLSLLPPLGALFDLINASAAVIKPAGNGEGPSPSESL